MKLNSRAMARAMRKMKFAIFRKSTIASAVRREKMGRRCKMGMSRAHSHTTLSINFNVNGREVSRRWHDGRPDTFALCVCTNGANWMDGCTVTAAGADCNVESDDNFRCRRGPDTPPTLWRENWIWRGTQKKKLDEKRKFVVSRMVWNAVCLTAFHIRYTGTSVQHTIIIPCSMQFIIIDTYRSLRFLFFHCFKFYVHQFRQWDSDYVGVNEVNCYFCESDPIRR